MRKFVPPKSNARRRSADDETPKAEFWRKVIDEYRASHKSARQFCKRHKLSLNKLRYWTRVFKAEKAIAKVPTQKKSQSKSFLPAILPARVVASPKDNKGRSVEIELNCGRVLRLNDNFEIDVLKKVIVALEELS